MTATAVPYSRAQVEAAIWWLVRHPEEMALVSWLATNEPQDEAVIAQRARLASRRRADDRMKPTRIHGCPHCRCLPAGVRT